MFIYAIIALACLSSAHSYDFSFSSCQDTTHQQSPINLVSSQSLYYDEKYFRFLTNNYNKLPTGLSWSVFPEERAVGFKPADQTNFGSFLLVKDWGMYNFFLQKVLFRLGSEHQIDGKSFDVEMQLVHVLDPNYYPPGKRISLNQNYLTISVFFNRTYDINPARSRLFEFSNLQGFSNGTNAAIPRDIKLHYMIQHQPSYLYEGTLTYPECQGSLWMIFSQFHYISQTDYANLASVIRKNQNLIDTTSLQNTRNIKKNVNTPVYRNWNDFDRMTPKPTLLAYNSATRINLSYISLTGLVFIIFCLILN